MDYTSFSHGQVHSKLWLCQNIEPYIPDQASIAILGAWYNVLGFMLLTRNPKKYRAITGIDVDPTVKPIADSICNAWVFGSDLHVCNITQDACDVDLTDFQVVLNCSTEHMKSNDWFYQIPNGTLVGLQSACVYEEEKLQDWKITNPNNSLAEFTKKYPLSSYYLRDTMKIQYDHWGYDRFMIIGVK